MIAIYRPLLTKNLPLLSRPLFLLSHKLHPPSPVLVRRGPRGGVAPFVLLPLVSSAGLVVGLDDIRNICQQLDTCDYAWRSTRASNLVFLLVFVALAAASASAAGILVALGHVAAAVLYKMPEVVQIVKWQI